MSVNTGVCEFSPCRQYRYVLIRELGDPMVNVEKLPGSFLLVIGLNPSTADETQNDPTITRCIGFAQKWGFRKLVMMNIFAFRATDPREMKRANDPIGPVNNRRLIEIAKHCQARTGIVLAAWGIHGAHRNRQAEVKVMMEEAGVQLMCLGVTSKGFPRHPLYIPGHYLPLFFT